MKITPKPTPTTFTDLIDGLKIDEKQNFTLNCTSGVRSAIYRIKQRSEKEFTTSKIKGYSENLIQVTRIK